MALNNPENSPTLRQRVRKNVLPISIVFGTMVGFFVVAHNPNEKTCVVNSGAQLVPVKNLPGDQSLIIRMVNAVPGSETSEDLATAVEWELNIGLEDSIA